jgi:flagellar protein FlgJ
MDPILPLDVRANPAPPDAAVRPSAGADRLRETAQELEGVFLGLLMKAMRSTVGNGGLFKEGTASQTYRDMFDQEVVKNLARAGGIGLAQMILRDQLLRQAAGDTRQDSASRGVSEPVENTVQ